MGIFGVVGLGGHGVESYAESGSSCGDSGHDDTLRSVNGGDSRNQVAFTDGKNSEKDQINGE